MDLFISFIHSIVMNTIRLNVFNVHQRRYVLPKSQSEEISAKSTISVQRPLIQIFIHAECSLLGFAFLFLIHPFPCI